MTGVPKAPPKSWPNVFAPLLGTMSTFAFLPEKSLESWTLKTTGASRVTAGAARVEAARVEMVARIVEAFILGG